MIPIRTLKGKLYGMLNLQNYQLEIRENKITRLIPISKEGVTLQLIMENNLIEEIYIPPQKQLMKA